jgi:hypothetical protein
MQGLLAEAKAFQHTSRLKSSVFGGNCAFCCFFLLSLRQNNSARPLSLTDNGQWP